MSPAEHISAFVPETGKNKKRRPQHQTFSHTRALDPEKPPDPNSPGHITAVIPESKANKRRRPHHKTFFGYARAFVPETPPPDYEIFRTELPMYGIGYCDTHLTRMQERGDFPSFVYQSPRKKFITFETLTAFKAVVSSGFKWRQWTVAKRPLSEVYEWIALQQAKLTKGRKGAVR